MEVADAAEAEAAEAEGTQQALQAEAAQPQAAEAAQQAADKAAAAAKADKKASCGGVRRRAAAAATGATAAAAEPAPAQEAAAAAISANGNGDAGIHCGAGPAPSPPLRRFVLGLHPHGSYPTGAGFVPLMPSVQRLFPGLKIVTLTATIIHYLPAIREIAAWAGFRQVGAVGECGFARLPLPGKVLCVWGGEGGCGWLVATCIAVIGQHWHRHCCRESPGLMLVG